jgi:hypothetical protein
MFRNAFLFASLVAAAATAGATTIDFEQYTQGTQITNQYAAQGITFTNAEELTVPNYYSYGYPPHSGSGVINNWPDATLTMTFSTPQTLVSGYYSSGLDSTVTAYDSMGNLVATVFLPFSYTTTSMFSISGTGITTVDFNTSLATWLTLDDVSFNSPVPEPSSIALLGTGLLAGAGALRRKLRS